MHVFQAVSGRAHALNFQATIAEYHTVIMSCALPNWEGTQSDYSDQIHL